MSTLAFTSPDFPGPPSVSLEVDGAVGDADAEAADEIVRSVLTTVRAQPWTALAATTQGAGA